MTMMIAAWSACTMLVLWALFVAGRLRSAGVAAFVLVLGTAPLAGLVMAQLPSPQLSLVELLSWGAVSAGLLTVWAGAVRWARSEAPSPLVDASRMRWQPRASHRPTWVITAGLSVLLTLALVAVDRPLVAALPWISLVVAHRWAHRGERGALRVEARDVVLAGERIAFEAVTAVAREVHHLGPVRRDRLVMEHDGRRRYLLVTGSPLEDVVAVQLLLHRQRELACDSRVEREPARLPPDWLRDIHEAGRPPVALRSDGEATEVPSSGVDGTRR